MAPELVHDGVLTLSPLVQKLCHAPAERLDVAERGHLREGYWADLVFVALDRPQAVARGEVLCKCGWSPLEGDVLRSTIAATIVNGELNYRDGQFVGKPNGQRLQFDR